MIVEDNGAEYDLAPRFNIFSVELTLEFCGGSPSLFVLRACEICRWDVSISLVAMGRTHRRGTHGRGSTTEILGFP